MNQPWVPFVTALVYGCAAFLAIRFASYLCDGIVPFEDGPKPGRPPEIALVLGAMLMGALLAFHGFVLPLLGLVVPEWQILEMLIGLVLATALVACTYTDIRSGIVPDLFTLVPLGLIVLLFVLLQVYWSPISAVLIATPFVVAAILSKGRGMGWGDVKLIALGGAVLGLQTAVFAAAAACLSAVLVAYARRKRTEPIAFAPYLAGAIALATTFKIFP
jgi:prepilin signal peptidase PulO-like enzyme (type II secretory pathway)